MIQRFEVGSRMSQAVKANGFIFISGQVAADPVPSVADQTHQVLAQIDKLLADTGSDKNHIVYANIFLADIADYKEVNDIWEAWVVPGLVPARATIGALPAAPQYLVEIAAMALPIE